jgi:2-succinyl-6-hydroxy-2,4-cyclohexadiene-1-carboxylate synthase
MVKTVIIRDYPYQVTIAGEGQPTWLFLHGFLGSSADFDGIDPNGTSVKIDLLGFGSNAPEVPLERFEMAEQIADIIAVLDNLDIEKVNIVGYSMGGRLALGVAMVHPERVAKLILEGGTAGLNDAVVRQERILSDNAKADTIEQDGMASFVAAWEQLPMFASQKMATPAQRAFMHEQRIQSPAPNVANSLRGMGAGAQPNFWPDLQRLNVPVTLIAGDLDQKFQAIATQMAARLPDARIQVVAQAGHNVHFEQPTAYLQVLADV